MLFKEAVNTIDGLRFLVDRMEFNIPVTRRRLFELPFLDTPEVINKELDRSEQIYSLLCHPFCPNLEGKLRQIRDMETVIERLRNGSALDDIDFYELKLFSILSGEIGTLTKDLELDFISIPNLAEITTLLDPDKSGTAHFYMYDSYSPELAEIRCQLKAFRMAKNPDECEIERLTDRKEEIERQVAGQIADRIRPFVEDIKDAFEQIIYSDLLLTKGKLAATYQMRKPEVSFGKTIYYGIFNPETASELKAVGKRFQPVDLSFDKGTTLITGANMGGKSVLLKSAALAQILFQYGFFVPAKTASIVPVKRVLISKGDGEDKRKGLSSFAGEILRIHEIIELVEKGGRNLVLIDEPASSTNPKEGRAIVNALIEMLNNTESAALITTHYDGIRNPSCRLRVKGIRTESMVEGISARNIGDLMDYSIIPDMGESTPQEALRVSRLLGVSRDLIERAEKYLKD